MTVGQLSPEEISLLGKDRYKQRLERIKASCPEFEFDIGLKIGSQEVGATVCAWGEWTPAFPGSRETPAEPRSFMVDLVELNGQDITDWLNDDWFSGPFYDQIYRR